MPASTLADAVAAPAPRFRRAVDGPALRLFVCGAAALFWELVLIRWLGASIRIVAYFANLVLISAFFGLGVGALATRFPWRLERLIAPLAALAALLGVWLGPLWHMNPATEDEYIWIATPGAAMSGGAVRLISTTLVLTLVYAATALLFVAFGQYLGRLFTTKPPLRAYSIEVAGSLAGIGLFALLSRLQTTPTAWFVAGFGLVALLLAGSRSRDAVVAVVLGVGVVVGTLPGVRGYVWSPYYRIAVTLLTPRGVVSGPVPPGDLIGHVLRVNSDYHQMMLDLRPRAGEPAFLASWRGFYDAPYARAAELPAGPILVVGAGTGNDVAAALRNTDRRVTAVEIDPAIARLGRELHAERPYQDARVTLVVDDARSFFHRAPEKYALVVFGFLDSHRLLSAFSSVRLDNFIYTRDSMREVRGLLAPGGEVAVSFATTRPWIHVRMVDLLDGAFDLPTEIERDPRGYSNGVLYLNRTRPDAPAAALRPEPPRPGLTPTDDWPFLYLRRRAVPAYNVAFLSGAIVLSLGALLLLPRGERRIRMPYLLLGAAFFLLETSNVVRMALLYGSTWWVNTIVFAGILVLVLLSNLTAARWSPPLSLCLALLGACVLLAATVSSETLLALSPGPRAVVAVALLLGPVYFAGLIFARLIVHETRLFEAYGSNVLGAVLGGAAEYLSLVFGFRFLLAVALALYLGVFLLLRRDRAALTLPGGAS